MQKRFVRLFGAACVFCAAIYQGVWCAWFTFMFMLAANNVVLSERGIFQHQLYCFVQTNAVVYQFLIRLFVFNIGRRVCSLSPAIAFAHRAHTSFIRSNADHSVLFAQLWIKTAEVINTELITRVFLLAVWHFECRAASIHWHGDNRVRARR